MKKNKLHTPDGFQDYLPQDFFMKMEMENTLRGVFQSYGYMPVSSPVLEYMEVFEGAGSTNPRHMYRFFDRDGGILALRSDMTPPVARMAATNFSADDMPLRLCYVEPTFHFQESFQGKTGEYTQAGVELMGAGGSDASGEVLMIAIQSLLSAGLTHFRVDIGQVDFLKGALDETELLPDAKATVIEHILARDYVAAERCIHHMDIPSGVKELLSNLPLLTGDLSILHKAKQLIHNERSLRALRNLEKIHHILSDCGLAEHVLFDLGMLGHLDYYTGIIFRGYAFGSGFSILDGGRYDNLLSQFGETRCSVGFAIRVDNLITALQSQNHLPTVKQADSLLAYAPAGRKTAFDTGKALRAQGVLLENSLLGSDLDANIAYAKKKNLGGLLYFMDDTRVKVIDLQNNEQNEVLISDLYQEKYVGEGNT